MGSSATPARTRLARRLPAVAAPVVCGAAAAFAVAATPAASMAATAHPVAQTAAQSATQAQARVQGAHRAPVAVTRPAAPARLTAVTSPARHAAAAAAATAATVSYTVKPGDSLSAIAQRVYSDSGFWPVLFWANHGEIRYANDIGVGQVLTVPAKPAHAPAAPSALSEPAPAPAHTSSYEASAPAEGSAQEESAPVQYAPSQEPTASSAGDSSFQQCVISRESGGDSQVTNSSGHYGLYQFSSSTWAAYGGNPADFGNASVSEQNQVFDNAVAAGGSSNWSAYDGC